MSLAGPRRLNTVDSGGGAWVLGPVVGRADAPRLCAELADRLRATTVAGTATAPYTTAPYTVDIRGVAEPDVGTVETLARLQLTARRFGRRLWFRANAHGTGHRLRELVGLAGLEAILPLDLS
jgi:hypothetical protein